MEKITTTQPQQGIRDDFEGTSPALEDIVADTRNREEAIANAVRAAANETPTGEGAQPYHAEQKIDLGDGKGVQVFKADAPTAAEAWESVSKQLAQAQEHATRKIRELTSRPGDKPEPKPLFTPVDIKPRELSTAEALAIVSQFNDNPAKGFDALIEARLGANPQAIANGLNLVQQLWKDRAEQNATTNWAKKHSNEYWQEEDFIPNLQKVAEFLIRGNYPLREENLEWAYNQLVAQGELLIEAPAETPTAEELAAAEQEKVRAAAAAQSSSRTAPPTFVSGRFGQRTEQAQVRQGVDVSQLNSLSLTDMKAAIERRMKEGQR